MRRALTRRIAAGLALASFAWIACSCSTAGYYPQAARGHLEIMRKARPNLRVIAAPDTKETVRKRLRLVEELRAFARDELKLPAAGQYDRYADLKRRYVVWGVYAAPEFSTEAVTWWYPLIGRLKYRGYFDEAGAEELARALRSQGLDVYVGGVEAYSTLGWFRDPVLNTFIGRDETDLAELIFHELTHQKVFFSGDTDFNEAFATANAEDGVRRWLRSQGRMADLAEYEHECRMNGDFVDAVLRTRNRLRALYAKKELPREVLAERKAVEIARLKAEAKHLVAAHGVSSRVIDRWFSKPVNNARLNTVAAYYDLVPGFERLLRDCGGDLEAFHTQVSAMRRLSKAARHEKLGNLAKAGKGSAGS